jgi:pilus assembly protein CpaF
MANQFSGSICSIRAKTPMGVISQLTSSALINNKNLNQEIVSYIISKAIDYIVHVGKLHDGPKKITSITKVSQLNKTTIHLEDIFIYMMKNTSAQNETVGQFVSTIIK